MSAIDDLRREVARVAGIPARLLVPETHANAIDEVRRAITSTDVEVGPPIWPTPEGAIEEYRKAVDAALEGFYASVLEEARRDRRQRLFGHPHARVFILGDRLAVVHPQDGAA